MPEPSSWKTPIVSPLAKRLKAFLSFKGILFKSISNCLFSLTNSTAFPKIDKFLIPKRSIFTKPASSTANMSYWETSFSPLASFCKGVKRVISSGAITIPAA